MSAYSNVNLNTAVKPLSLVERTHEFLIKPAGLADACLGAAYYHTTGKMAVGYGYASSGLFLVQTITSLAAIPFQMIAGIFAFVHHAAKNEIREGLNELKLGFLTSGNHIWISFITPVVSVGIAAIVTLGLPHYIRVWNIEHCWWDGDRP